MGEGSHLRVDVATDHDPLIARQRCVILLSCLFAREPWNVGKPSASRIAILHIIDASPARSARIHLTTFRELERHCHDEAKHGGYQHMLRELGIDTVSFAELVEQPRLLIAEQPGNWFYSDDLIRFRLFDVLKQTRDFHQSSGVLSLAIDGFSSRGLKKYLHLLHFHEKAEPVPLVGASFLRRYRNRVYSALPLSGSAYERMVTILDSCITMLTSAQISPNAFAEEVLAIFRGGLRSGIRPLFPRRADRRGLRELGTHLAEYDLEGAKSPLLAARQELRRETSWADYWDRVNASFLGTRIGRLGPLLNRFLVTVEDPVGMSHNLIRRCEFPVSEPVAVAAIITDDDKFRVVFFDPTENSFFYCPRVGTRCVIAWRQVRRLAEQGRTGGPSGTLEYLLMAASGIYLLTDPSDGYNRFERLARRIHEHYTGLPFPVVSFVKDNARTSYTYLEMFEPAFEDRCRLILERFFA